MKKNLVFSKDDSINNMTWDKFYLYLDNETKTLIVLASLYQKEIITLNKLKGQLSSLRKGTLLGFKRSYRCGLNGKWYNDEPFANILEDLHHSSVSYEKLLEVIQLYENKNYNSCINFLIEFVIKPHLKRFSNTDYFNSFDQVFNTNLYNFPKIENEGYKVECSCCGSEHFEKQPRLTIERGEKLIKEYFHQYKRGNLTKIPC